MSFTFCVRSAFSYNIIRSTVSSSGGTHLISEFYAHLPLYSRVVVPYFLRSPFFGVSSVLCPFFVVPHAALLSCQHSACFCDTIFPGFFFLLMLLLSASSIVKTNLVFVLLLLVVVVGCLCCVFFIRVVSRSLFIGPGGGRRRGGGGGERGSLDQHVTCVLTLNIQRENTQGRGVE